MTLTRLLKWMSTLEGGREAVVGGRRGRVDCGCGRRCRHGRISGLERGESAEGGVFVISSVGLKWKEKS